jgi:hypothetical protein
MIKRGEINFSPPKKFNQKKGNMKTKICSKCKKELDITKFFKGNDKDGLCYVCKLCNLKRISKWQKLHSKKWKEYQSNWYLKNREQILEHSKKYFQDNKDKIINYRKNKYRKDLNFRLKDYLRHRIWSALKGLNKSESTMKLIGCSVEYLKQHLESKFTKGMSFDNYGKWHIDHIKPCASFDLSKPSEQKKCFHYTNLQPLWAEDNLRKNDNYD